MGSSSGVKELAHLSLPIAEYELRVTNVAARMSMIQRPAEKIAFTDVAIANPNLIEYSFVEAPLLPFAAALAASAPNQATDPVGQSDVASCS